MSRWRSCLGKNSSTGETRLLLPALGAGVAARRLSAGGEFPAVTVPAPGADVLEALDIEGDLATQFAFREFLFDTSTDTGLIRLAESVRLRVQIDAELNEDFLAERTPDALDRRESDFDTFIAGEDDAGDTEHTKRLVVSGKR